eukprot:3640688-Amphidinium_carterae.1
MRYAAVLATGGATRLEAHPEVDYEAGLRHVEKAKDEYPDNLAPCTCCWSETGKVVMQERC